MEHNYTQNFLIKFLYKETNLVTSLEIENSIQEDKTTGLQYNNLLQAFRMLPRVKFNPSDKSMDSILHYSRTGQLLPSFR